MSKKGDKLLQRAKQSPNNWSRNDLEQLYSSFGFEVKHGAKHDITWHPDHPDLQGTLPRHAKFVPGYVRSAVKLIETLLERKDSDSESGDEENTDE